MHTYELLVKRTVTISLAFALLVVPGFSRERTDSIPAGNWAAVESAEKGTSISIRMGSGDRMDGKFLGLDASAIRITADKQERIFPRSSVTEVWQLRVPDRKLNGAVYGMAAGAAAGLITAGAMGYLKPTGDTAGSQYKYGFLFAGIGLGAAFGLAADSLIKSNRLLYRK